MTATAIKIPMRWSALLDFLFSFFVFERAQHKQKTKNPDELRSSGF
jgi:hypothetical protein